MSSEDMEMAYEHLSALADKESDANEKDDNSQLSLLVLLFLLYNWTLYFKTCRFLSTIM